MGATAFRNKKTSRGQYKARKAARLRGELPKSRDRSPWWAFRTPIATLEMELAKFGERARYRDRFREAYAREVAGLES